MFRSAINKITAGIRSYTQLSANRPVWFVFLCFAVFFGTAFAFFGLGYFVPESVHILVPWVIMPLMGLEAFYFWPLTMRAMFVATSTTPPSLFNDIFELYGGVIKRNGGYGSKP